MDGPLAACPTADARRQLNSCRKMVGTPKVAWREHVGTPQNTDSLPETAAGAGMAATLLKDSWGVAGPFSGWIRGRAIHVACGRVSKSLSLSFGKQE